MLLIPGYTNNMSQQQVSKNDTRKNVLSLTGLGNAAGLLIVMSYEDSSRQTNNWISINANHLHMHKTR